MSDQTNAWKSEDGRQAQVILDCAGLLDNLVTLDALAMYYERDNGQTNLTMRDKDVIELDIRRDAARVFLEKHCPTNVIERDGSEGHYKIIVPGGAKDKNGFCRWIILGEGIGYDAALIAAVLAVGKEKP